MRYVDYAVEQIRALVNIPSPSGFTRQATDYLMKELEGMGYAPARGKKGSVTCRLFEGERPILLSAHVDTLGAMVRSVKSNGRLRYTSVGGFAHATVEIENCLVHTREGKAYSGTVQSIHASQHVYPGMRSEERTEENVEIVLDEMVKTAEDVKKLGVDTGCFISWDPRFVLTDSGFIKSRHLDDKASSAVLLALAKAIRDGAVKPARGVDILFTVYEEEGHGAAPVSACRYDEMLALDMGCVGDDLSCDETMVSICCKDSSGPYNYDMTNRLVRLAQRDGLSYAVDVYPSYSSDASAALRGGLDARHALIGPGVFASHGYERTHVKGIENTYRLTCAYLQETPEE